MGYRGLQGVTRGFRGLQRVTRGYTGLQGVTRGYRRLPGITDFYKGLQVNSNIKGDSLDRSGLHLNGKGVYRLACNFRVY